MLPLKVAVTFVEPRGNVERVTLALPPTNVMLPRLVVPAVKLTVPVTLAVALVTFAVKVTA